MFKKLEIFAILKLVLIKVAYNYIVDLIKKTIPVLSEETKELIPAVLVYVFADKFKLSKEMTLILKVEAATDIIQQVIRLALPEDNKYRDPISNLIEGNNKDDFQYYVNGEMEFINEEKPIQFINAL